MSHLAAITVCCSLLGAAPGAPGYTLDELLELASNHNRQIQEARMGVSVQVAQHDRARWAWFTPIEISGFIAGPIPEARGNPLKVTEASEVGDVNLGRVGLLFQTEVKGAIPLFTFGKLSSLESAAERGVEVATANVDRVAAEVAHNVRLAFYAHATSKDFLELAADTETTVDDALQKGMELLEVGSPQVTAPDLFRLRSLRARLLGRRAEAERGYRSTLDALRQLTGQDYADLVVNAPPVAAPPRRLKPLAVVEALVAPHRPEARLVEAGVRAREQLLELRESAYYPDLFLAGGFRYSTSNAATDQKNPFIRDDYNYMEGGVGVGARVTLDFVTKTAQVDEARAELGKMSTQKELALSAMLLQVRADYQAYHYGQESLAHFEEATRAARSWVVSEKIAFDVGTGRARDLFDGIESLAEAQAQQRRVIFELNRTLSALQLSTGCEPDAFSELEQEEDGWE